MAVGKKPAAAAAEDGGGTGIDTVTPLKTLASNSLKRTRALFQANGAVARPATAVDAQKLRLSCKVRDEYESVLELPATMRMDAAKGDGTTPKSAEATEGSTAVAPSTSDVAKMIDSLPVQKTEEAHKGLGIIEYKDPSMQQTDEKYKPSAAIMKRLPSKWPKPVWHAPWKLYRVISGHLGWVRSIAFDPGNEWFVTGSQDRTIKVWDTATGTLKITLTGHIEQIRGLAVSQRHPYMFSAGDDCMVKCWDLEYNKVIRNYHGHLSGVYCMALHPTLDVLMTGGRDSVCRVWDIRTKAQVHCLSGHQNTVCSVIAQAADPQVITGSHDSQIKTWDLAAGKTMSTLTFHKKSVRTMCMHPREYTFAAASADNIKKYRLPKGEFLHNMLSQQKSIINSMAVNEDDVMVTGGDNGSLWFWDWRSGHCFQRDQAVVQPGSLDSESGIYALSFDVTGSRLVTCEADKTIKMWKEDSTATPESHPVNFKPPSSSSMNRF